MSWRQVWVFSSDFSHSVGCGQNTLAGAAFLVSIKPAVMRILFIVAGLLLLAEPLLAQTERNWGLVVFPQLGHRRLLYTDAYTREDVAALEAAERFRPGVSLGVLSSRRVDKIGLQFGLQYANVGYLSPRTDYALNDPDRGIYTSFRQGYRVHQIHVPLSINFYQDLGTKDAFYFMFGLNLGYQLSADSVLLRYTGEITDRQYSRETNQIRAFQQGFQTAMGWERKLGNRIVLAVQPTFIFWFSGVFPPEIPLNRDLYQVGLSTSVRLQRPWEE